MNFRRLLSCHAIAVLLAALPADLYAALPEKVTHPPPTIKDGYHHTSWTSQDGAPTGIWTITQTIDGWLWVGSASGLYRFDGVSFTSMDLRSPESLESRGIRSLTTTRSGDLWVSFYYGGAAVLSRDTLRPQSPPGLPDNDYIAEFIEDGSGNIWGLARSGGRYVLEEGRWHIAGPDWGLPPSAILQAKLDSQGSLWVSTQDGIYVLRKGTRRFLAAQTNAAAGARIGIAHSGQLWKLDADGYAPLAGPDVPSRIAPKKPLPSATAAPVLLARDGSFWSVDCPVGVCRTRPGAEAPSAMPDTSTDTFTRADGLSSDRPMTLFEDTEGDIWAGTKQGLDRFRRNDLQSVHFPNPLIYFAMVPDAQGGIWLGTNVAYQSATNYLWRLDPQPSLVPGFSGAILAAFAERDGSILLGGLGAAWRMSDGRFQPLSVPPGEDVRALARDRDGHLWTFSRSAGTFRLDGDQWVRNGNVAGLPDKSASVLALDDAGWLWLGYSDNRVFRVEGSKTQVYSSVQGLNVGAVTAIWVKDGVTLFGGELGLDALNDGRIVTLHGERPEALRGITGILRARDGTLWLNGNAGAVRITAGDLVRALSEPTFAMPLRMFNTEDGMPGSAQSHFGSPSVVEDQRGRLWFAATDGLAWLDPKHLRPNLENPNVEILSVATPSQKFTAIPSLSLPSRTENLSIRYTALSLAMPERMQFRVRLSGVDEGWRDVDTDRSIGYSNLGPGSYRFEVAVANADGNWSDRATSLDFRIQPAFFQTMWFKALCAGAVFAALLGFVRLRSRRIAARASAKMRERLKERERIARELHDTLIQDVEAFVLNLRALKRRLGDREVAHQELSRLDNAAQRSLELARARVGELRAIARSNTYLRDVLQELGEQLTALYPAKYRLEVTGRPRDLQPAIAEEIAAIGREAILNAFRHANASSISVTIGYTARALDVTVDDDGKGFSGESAASERNDHWGLRGMRERAHGLRAQLAFAVPSSGGTRVHLRVAGAVVYAEQRSAGGLWRKMFKWAGLTAGGWWSLSRHRR